MASGGVLSHLRMSGEKRMPSAPVMMDVIRKKTGAGSDDFFRLGNPLRPQILPDEDDRGHRDAENGADQKEHDEIGVGRRGQGGFAEQLADPDCVDGTVQRLEHVAKQNRNGKKEQRPGDRPFRHAGPDFPGLRTGHRVYGLLFLVWLARVVACFNSRYYTPAKG